MITKRLSTFLAVLISFASHNKIFAAISPLVTPFSGDAIETWEAFPIGNSPRPLTIFNGAATITGPNPVIWRTVTSPQQEWGLYLGSYTVKAFDGTNGFSASAQGVTARIDFQSPVTDFGAYWASASTWGYTPPIELNFFDSQGISIGEASFTYSRPGNNGTMEWQGWHSSEPIYSITYKGDWVAIDSARITIVPEPRMGLACLAFLATSFTARRLTRGPI